MGRRIDTTYSIPLVAKKDSVFRPDVSATAWLGLDIKNQSHNMSCRKKVKKKKKMAAKETDQISSIIAGNRYTTV